MSAQAPAQVKAVSTPAAAVKPTGLASHTCACGGSHRLGDECAECRQKRLRVQRRASEAPDLFATQLKSPAPVALNYHFSRVSVRQAHSEQSGAEREARDEQEADRAAEQLLQGSERLMSQSSTPLSIRRRALDEEEEISVESTNTPESEGTESTTAATTETTPEVAGPETELTPETGRGPEPATAETSAGETSIGGLIVEDDVSPGPGQISKDAFLNELRASACAAADAELAAVGRSTGGCPYVERLIGYYRTKSSEHLERAMRKYAPETAGVTKAREYIPLISERIRQGTARWAQTGRISGVPEELLTQVSSAGLLSDIPSAASSALRNV
ncbi:MAG TPA: hypothetical protein VLG46_01770, partial [Anaerolineae bacterium]|nr:hypothetical protein [Anaerolineae bacterium]